MMKGWETKELGAVSAINYGYTESASTEPIGPRFLRITDIQDDRVDWESVPYCKIEKADLPKYRLASGDIVFARTGATTGKSFLVDEPPDAVFASYLIRLRLLDKRLLPEFVLLFFQTAGYWQSIKDGSSGSAQGGFNATKLGALTIPVPPLVEQQRIVGLLDEAFEGLATAKATAEKNLQNARALFESHLQSAFTQRGPGWVEKRLWQLGKTKDSIVSGPFGSNLKVSDYKNEGVPILRLQNVGKGYFIDKNIKYISREKEKELKYHSFMAGDIVLAKLGIPVGKTCIVPNKFAQGIITADVVRIRPDPAVVDYKLLTYLLNTDISVLQLTGSISGATRPRVNLSDVRDIELNLPPLKDQQKIVREFDILNEETQRLARLYERKHAALEALKKSLLHQAFSGEL